jgi:hypothetical protein
MVYICSTTQAIFADLWHCESGGTTLDVKKDPLPKKFSSAIIIFGFLPHLISNFMLRHLD